MAKMQRNRTYYYGIYMLISIQGYLLFVTLAFLIAFLRFFVLATSAFLTFQFNKGSLNPTFRLPRARGGASSSN
jgi:hypothetical protein